MLPEIRPALTAAIARTRGVTAESARTKAADTLATLTDEQIERYQIHGLVIVPLHVTFATVGFIIDTNPLKSVTLPRNAWVRKSEPNDLFIAISSGKQQSPKRALEFPKDKNLEGLLVRLYFKVSPLSPIPYEAKAIPLYAT